MNDNQNPPTEARDDVATLIRIAGKRPEVPPERAARVRATARAQWKQEVRRLSRRRYAYGAVAPLLELLRLVGRRQGAQRRR